MAWVYIKNSLPYIVGVTVGFIIYESLKQQRSGARLGRRLARRAHLLGHPVLSGFVP
jgi:hypothetical protein